ncbi:MAG: hypothetical protein PWP47_1577 [Synergistaceae bacterium]|nr:hypothetical protein [Synergistaceae bacterium]
MVSPEPPGFFVGVPGRGGRRVKRTGCAGLDLRFAGACFGLSSPDGQRHLGEAVLGSLTRKGGAVVLNVASEGSTDTISFNVRVEKSGGGRHSPLYPHFRTNRRRRLQGPPQRRGSRLRPGEGYGLSGRYTLSAADRVRLGKTAAVNSERCRPRGFPALPAAGPALFRRMNFDRRF